MTRIGYSNIRLENRMLNDIQRQFETVVENTTDQNKTYVIPRDYVVPNTRIQIDGQGILQRFLEANHKKN